MKIMRELLPLVIMLFAFSCVAKESTPVTKQLKVNSFDAIEAECVDVFVTVGPATGSLSVTASPEVMEKFSARVNNGTLKLTALKNGSNNSFNNFFKKNKRPVVRITVPTLREIDAELSSKIIVDQPFAVNNLEVSCETSSSVKLAGITATGEVELKAETSSTVNVASLSSATVEADSETSSTISIGSLKASAAELNAETASSIKIDTVNVDRLEADAETASSIKAVGGTVKYGRFSAETASTVNFEGVSVLGGTSDNESAGKVKVRFGTR